MGQTLNTKRIGIYLGIVIAVGWIVALAVYFSGMTKSSPTTAMTLANYIIIMTPALAAILTRLITKEGWKNLWLRPNFRRGWRFYLAAWLLPLLAVIIGAAAYYLLFPQSFDANLTAVRAGLGNGLAINPWTLLPVIILQSALLAVPINTVVSMGEEFGWRAYLLQKLATFFSSPSAEAAASPTAFSAPAARKASLLVGLIWGVWHWPLFWLSMQIDPSMPVLYPVIYLAATCAMSVLLCWVTLRSGSVWPASIGHGAINAFSGLVVFTIKGPTQMLLGPETGGLIGSLGFILLALLLLTSRKAFADKETRVVPTPAVEEA